MRVLIFLTILLYTEACSEIRSPLCQTGIPYNSTVFPNLAGHLFQGGAVVGLQNIKALIDQKCSPNIREFLCRVYFPECYKDQPVLPSWEMCQEAYEGCNSLMTSLGYSWSFSLNCAKFEKSTIDEIKKKAADKDEFWFGNGVNTLCNTAHPTLACKNNIHPGVRDSISTRLGLDVSQVDRLLQINYTYGSESFTSCHNRYSMPGGSFQADPLSPNAHHPFEVRNMPTITWNADSSKYYSLIVVDVGMKDAHAVYINIPGNDISRATSIVAYTPPMNPTSTSNPYAFLLYEQTGTVSVSQEMARKVRDDPVEAVKHDRHFVGPKALSWVRVTLDPYSIKTLEQLGVINNCPYLVSQALHKHPESFIPSNAMLEMSVDVTYAPVGIHFTSCCKTYVYHETSFALNPIGDMTVKTAHVRSSAMPTVNLKKRDWYPNATQFENSERYTLVMVDADAGSAPYIHWMVINIKKGDVNEGVTEREYKGPQPPSGVHTYYFLLYKQQGDINPAVMSNYTTSCSRCNFKISKFVSDNHLQLVGANWMLAGHDEYVRHLHVDENSRDIASVCAHQPGYPSACLNGGISVVVG